MLAGQISDAIITWSKLSPACYLHDLRGNRHSREICKCATSLHRAPLRFRLAGDNSISPRGPSPANTRHIVTSPAILINYNAVLSWIVSVSICGYQGPANFRQVAPLAPDIFLVFQLLRHHDFPRQLQVQPRRESPDIYIYIYRRTFSMETKLGGNLRNMDMSPRYRAFPMETRFRPLEPTRRENLKFSRVVRAFRGGNAGNSLHSCRTFI